MNNSNNTQELLLAAASIQDVLASFNESVREGNEPHDVEEQDRFARLLDSCRGEFCPPERKLHALVRLYINQIERDDEACVESDALVELVLQASIFKDPFPDADESSHLSFVLPGQKGAKDQSFLRIRQFLYHNDVSLRLWEAGACLAEFFLEKKSMIAHKKVIELGAGVGLTGFVLAGCCNASWVHLTDYTDACLLNLEHNISINKEWLAMAGVEPSIVTQGYLEWEDCANRSGTSDDRSTLVSFKRFRDADVLVAADVIYDVSVIESLVSVICSFLSRDSKNKEAILAITRRNMKTFEIFLQHLKEYGIFSEWIASGEDCNNLPHVFKCKFNQSRSDVRIARLKLNLCKN